VVQYLDVCEFVVHMYTQGYFCTESIEQGAEDLCMYVHIYTSRAKTPLGGGISRRVCIYSPEYFCAQCIEPRAIYIYIYIYAYIYSHNRG